MNKYGINQSHRFSVIRKMHTNTLYHVFISHNSHSFILIEPDWTDIYTHTMSPLPCFIKMVSRACGPTSTKTCIIIHIVYARRTPNIFLCEIAHINCNNIYICITNDIYQHSMQRVTLLKWHS